MTPVLIVAHGQPSDPGPAAKELRQLAARVAQQLPDHRVSSATLAEEGALAEQLAILGDGGRVYPLFMAGGWFTRVNLPSRLAKAGAIGWQVLEPFGCDPAVHQLGVDLVAEALPAANDAQVLIAAHGSFKSSAPSDVAQAVAAKLRAHLGKIPVHAAFIDQAPQLAHATGYGPNAVCLPYFAAAGGHVLDDIPAALKSAGFAGKILPALGLDPRVPGIIARAIFADQRVCVTNCRYTRQPA
jgi:sirohydrochlorin ferrochelatase